jgi:hypothetical protein
MKKIRNLAYATFLLFLIPYALKAQDNLTTLVVNPSKFEFPDFAKITFIEKGASDTIKCRGTFAGQANCHLDPNKVYDAYIEQGYEPTDKNKKGDYFDPYWVKEIKPNGKTIYLKKETGLLRRLFSRT